MNRIYLIVILFAIHGCASITKGTTQNVVVNTPNVKGAICTLSSNSIGSRVVTTPAITNLEKGKDAIQVRCSKECYDDGVAIIPSNFEGMTAGNILLGGIVGFGIDAATGAMNQYPSEVSIHMAKSNSCKRTG